MIYGASVFDALWLLEEDLFFVRADFRSVEQVAELNSVQIVL
ncbi:hypothetical protein LEP1GSC168_2736 [Leptospira santarosai str. HAI134]|nr:hypothetical protein LEP1GSC168_2736 [Leptospira santarosai str. HAI134]